MRVRMQLFNLDDDLSETRNLIDLPEPRFDFYKPRRIDYEIPPRPFAWEYGASKHYKPERFDTVGVMRPFHGRCITANSRPTWLTRCTLIGQTHYRAKKIQGESSASLSMADFFLIADSRLPNVFHEMWLDMAIVGIISQKPRMLLELCTKL